ncbi:MAG TPA: fumarylacetoacetate hydrolase family protein [Thermoleophilaceae bacterium]|jgi:2-oxo-3-hexenedioate decarboxylase|nr:fumarylacetoacetate hydrolase family protein [Thermoleophilaceae bacterium]
MNVERAAEMLLRAETDVRARAPLTDEWPELDLATAYEVQDALLSLRLSRGERVVGVKLGLTSEAKQRQMGVDEPIIAWLTDAMALPRGAAAPSGRMIQPRAEPEIVFRLGERIEGPGIAAHDALASVASVHAGVEILDSRYLDYKFTILDVVADNASAAGFLVGETGISPAQLDLTLEACLLEEDGVVVQSATGAAVQGNPAQALALAADLLADRGRALEAGWIVLTGGMTDAVPLRAGSPVSARFTNLGSLTARV